MLVSDGTHMASVLARAPRVIVIGDVHGCIDELQSLLRLADFQPGDQVVLLGDLVAKGPDSVGVVQMARDIGARTVRGNHDHEVIRGCEAAYKGYRNAMISLEHSRIANALGPEDYAWLIESPWFIVSPDTMHLFVHAGFIPGVKLTQQNPRLMMNMRSVLSDGTVTAKNVPDCEWAKLWRGPQTVVFGHDAHRGLQQHEYAKGIDTGCVYGGRLTALLLPENRFISVAAKRCYIRERGRYRTAPKS
jgi:predicted phosphodiesterase